MLKRLQVRIDEMIGGIGIAVYFGLLWIKEKTIGKIWSK